MMLFLLNTMKLLLLNTTMLLLLQDLVMRMQDPKSGVPIKNVKSFITKIPSVFTGENKPLTFTFILRKKNLSLAVPPPPSDR